MAGGYTFAADTAKLGELKDDLTGLKEDISNEITNIFDSISTGWQDAWQGEAYDIFVENCSKYKDALNEIPNVIDCFVKTIQETEEKSLKLINDVNEKLGEIK